MDTDKYMYLIHVPIIVQFLGGLKNKITQTSGYVRGRLY